MLFNVHPAHFKDEISIDAGDTMSPGVCACKIVHHHAMQAVKRIDPFQYVLQASYALIDTICTLKTHNALTKRKKKFQNYSASCPIFLWFTSHQLMRSELIRYSMSKFEMFCSEILCKAHLTDQFRNHHGTLVTDRSVGLEISDCTKPERAAGRQGPKMSKHTFTMRQMLEQNHEWNTSVWHCTWRLFGRSYLTSLWYFVQAGVLSRCFTMVCLHRHSGEEEEERVNLVDNSDSRELPKTGTNGTILLKPLCALEHYKKLNWTYFCFHESEPLFHILTVCVCLFMGVYDLK